MSRRTQSNQSRRRQTNRAGNPQRRRKVHTKYKFSTRRMYQRTFIALGAIVLFALVCVGWTIWLGQSKGDEYEKIVLSQQSYVSNTIAYRRGDILDRNGNKLASSKKVYNLVLDPKALTLDSAYFEPTTKALQQTVGMSEGAVRKIIDKKPDSHYYVVKKYKGLSRDVVDAFNELADKDKNIQGVWFEEEYKRMYPYNDLACSLLGFANSDNSATIGIESSYNSFLQGTDGREYGYMDSDNNMETVIKDAKDGDNIVSSIDMNIQRIVQKSIKKYMKKYSPKRISVVIANPNNGEILAMADDTTFDLNDPYNLEDYYTEAQISSMSQKKQSEKLNSIWNNYCITDSYEPGSTAKPFTVAAAFEEGKINRKSTFTCDGQEKVGGFTIKCHKVDGHGTITVKEAIAESCNDYMMHIGKLLGAKKFVQYQERFGFGTKTGIDLPNETRGLVYGTDMGSSTLATNSFGQNFTVNMIQMVSGFSSLINGGYYYEPRVVKQVITSDDQLVKNYSKTLVKQTITKETSDYIKECLRSVVTDGTGSTAAISGYTVGGKTGTAEKVDTSGKGKGRLKNQYILSFLGCVPCENPQVVCYTLMDTPKKDPQATAYNTELWTDIMKQVLPYLGVEKTEKIEKKAKKQNLETEFYSDGIIEGDDGSLVKKSKED